MTKRTYTTKSGDTYEWNETPEVIAALKKLHQTIRENNKNIVEASLNRPKNFKELEKKHAENGGDYGVGK